MNCDKDRWSRCFLRYTTMVGVVVGDANPRITLSMVFYHNKVVELAIKQGWEKVRQLAFTTHSGLLQRTNPYNAESWLEVTELLDFCYVDWLAALGGKRVEQKNISGNKRCRKIRNVNM